MDEFWMDELLQLQADRCFVETLPLFPSTPGLEEASLGPWGRIHGVGTLDVVGTRTLGANTVE